MPPINVFYLYFYCQVEFFVCSSSLKNLSRNVENCFRSNLGDLTTEKIEECQIIGDYYVGEINGRPSSWRKNEPDTIIEFTKEIYEYEISENAEIGVEATPVDGEKIRRDSK